MMALGMILEEKVSTCIRVKISREGRDSLIEEVLVQFDGYYEHQGRDENWVHWPNPISI